ncbi:MAG TPA: translation elongation factor Ts [Anaerolineales bacterium]|nr:translation elongation factor Ts [Anaerolineales bacterium]
MSVVAEQIKLLREQTGAGIKDCRDALEKSGGDLEKAAELLRAQGLAAASKRADRETRNGVLELYRHGEGRVGVIVEVNCETDFVGRTKEFREFAHEVALQVAAAAPRWVSPGDIPAEALAREADEARRVALADGTAGADLEKKVAGRLEKFTDEACLLRQPYIRDEARTVEDLLREVISTTGENVAIRRFIRWEVGETIE